MGTTETLVNTMRMMANIMGKSNAMNNVTSIQQALTIFQVETEKGNIMAETINDVMNNGEDMIDDEDADKLIAQVEYSMPASKGVGQFQSVSSLDSFQNRLQRLG